jgi:cell division septation protein DedD
MGKSVGETPLKIKQMDVFPTVYDQDKKNLYGVIQIKKPGCQDFNKRVSSGVVGKGIDAKLDCGTKSTAQPAMKAPVIQTSEQPPVQSTKPTTQQPPVQPTKQLTEPLPAQSTKPTTVQSLPTTAKERLIQLNELREEGLITEDEYRKARKHIIDAL